MREAANLIDSLIAEVDALEKRFAEHLDAWRANNEAHAKRIAELEQPAKCPRTHAAANTFWKVYCAEREKHGMYESTWAAIDAAMGNKDG